MAKKTSAKTVAEAAESIKPMHSYRYGLEVNGVTVEYLNLSIHPKRLSMMCAVKEDDPFGFELSELLSVGASIEITAYNTTGDAVLKTQFELVNVTIGEIQLDATRADVPIMPIDLEVIRR